MSDINPHGLLVTDYSLGLIAPSVDGSKNGTA